MFATGTQTVGLAEWIIDDTCLDQFVFGLNIIIILCRVQNVLNNETFYKLLTHQATAE